MSDDGLERVGAVVVNYDGGDALLSCVEALRGAGVGEVVVVDNASSDGSLARLAAADHDVVLVPTGANLGYGRAVNRGAARLQTGYLLVCNPDVAFDADAVKALVTELDQNPDAAIVGPRLLDRAGTTYPSGRAFPGMLDAAGHALIGLFRPNNPWSRRYRQQAADPGVPRTVDWLSGAFFVVRRIAFDSVGGFDEAYFMYVEDLDLCWRLKRAGWEARYVPAAIVVHDQGLSARRHPYSMIFAHHRSTWLFAKRRARGAERALLPVVGAGLTARLGLALCRERLVRRGKTGKSPG